MPTHDYIIANGTGAAVRADVNLALSAIVSLNSSASEPATMYAYQLWADTVNGLLKIRNSANSAWITLRQLDGDFSIVAVEDGLLATPSLTFTTDLNTGIFRPSTDSLGIVTGGQYAIACTSTQAVGIRTANPSAALHVAGIARIGADDATDAVLEIGAGATGNRESYIDLVGDTTYFDYGARFGRSAGANGITYFSHRGTGAISIQTTEAGPITFTTTGAERLRLSGSGDFVFKGAGTTPGTDKAVFFSTAAPINSMVLDSSGRLLVGTSTNTLNINNTDKQAIVLIGDDTYGGLAITGYNGTSNPTLRGPRLTLQRSRGTTDGSMTKVASDDLIGQISFRGADGTDFEVAATIEAYADGEFNTSSDATDSPGRLVFSTTADGDASPTERMRINSEGQFKTLTTSTNGHSIVTTQGASGSINLFLGIRSATNVNDGTAVFIVYSNGTYATLSDETQKKNIESARSGYLEDLKQLRVVKYNWKDQDDLEPKELGLIAQEVEQVFPGLVSEIQAESGDVNKGVKAGVLPYMLLKALQEATSRIESLEVNNADLLARVTALEAN